MFKLVLLRHGESTWNKENRFTGWTDVDLSDKGRDEARAAGRLLKAEGFAFDFVYTSGPETRDLDQHPGARRARSALVAGRTPAGA